MGGVHLAPAEKLYLLYALKDRICRLLLSLDGHGCYTVVAFGSHHRGRFDDDGLYPDVPGNIEFLNACSARRST